MQPFYENGGSVRGCYYNVSTLEDVVVGKGRVVFEGRGRCSTSVPQEEISLWAGQQEMAGAHTSTFTHVHGVICDGKGKQAWATILVVW